MLFVGLKSGKIYSISIDNISETFLSASNSDKCSTVTYTKWSKRSGHPASSCNPVSSSRNTEICSIKVYDRDWRKHYGFTDFADDRDLFYDDSSANQNQPPILRVKDVLRRKKLIHGSKLENLSSMRVIALS